MTRTSHHRRPMGGRGSRRGGGYRPASGPEPVVSRYLTGFVALTNYINGTGVAGSDAHTFWVAFVHRVSSTTGALACKANSSAPGTGGWSFRKSSTGIVDFRIVDGVGSKASPTIVTLGAGDVGKVTMIHGKIDVANNIIRGYLRGVEVGTGTATSGSFTASANAMGIGSRNGGGESVGSDADIVGFGAVSRAMSDADIAAHYAACAAALKVITPGGAGTINNWSGDDYDATAGTWVDEVSGSSLSETGAVTTGDASGLAWS